MNVIVVLGASSVVASVFLIWWAVSSSTPEAVGLRSDNGDLRTRILQQSAGDRLAIPAIERIGASIRRWSPIGRLGAISQKLDNAGSPAGWTVERVLGVKVSLSALLGLLMTLLFAGNLDLVAVILIFCSAAMGFVVPDVVLTHEADNRRAAISSDLSITIDQLSMMVEAGLGIDAAIARTARSEDNPLSEELARVVREIRVGIDRSVALANLAERADVPELRTFVAALAQAERLGSPVSQTLSIQSQEIRLKRRQHAEEQAMKLPVKLLFPMVFCIMPVLMVVLLAPAGIRIFDTLS